MKELSEKKKASLISQKEKELAKLARKQLKPVVGKYLIILFVMCTLNFCIDIFGSNFPDIMKADAIKNLLPGKSAEEGLQTYQNLTMIFAGLIGMSVPFYKALTDKYGRKPFLIINTLLCAVGMFISMISTNIYFYILGMVIAMLGTLGDVHQIYILEAAPKKLRARFASLTKGISVLSSSLIGVFKLLFQTEAVPESWRYVFIIPVLAGLLVGIFSCFFTQETEPFVENRKAILKQEICNLQGIEVIREENEEEAKKLTFKEVITFIFTHRQTLMLFIAAFFFCAANAFTTPYSLLLEEVGSDAVAIVSIIYPFIEGAFSVIGGIISDKFGRKTTVIANGIAFMIAYAVFILGSKSGLSIAALGVAYGFTTGGYWAGRDTLGTTMPSESVPTKSRATIVGIFTILTSAAFSISTVALSNIPALFGLDLGFTHLIGCDALMILAVIFVIIGVGETKNIDMDTVTGNEWNRKKKA